MLSTTTVFAKTYSGVAEEINSFLKERKEEISLLSEKESKYVQSLATFNDAVDAFCRRLSEQGREIASTTNVFEQSIKGQESTLKTMSDIVSSLSLDDKQFKVFANEVKQIVRPGGFFVCYVLSDKDEFYQRYGNGQGHYLAPKSDLLEYCRSKKEILDNFKKWKVIFSVEKEKVDDYYGKVYKRRLVWLLLQNEK